MAAVLNEQTIMQQLSYFFTGTLMYHLQLFHNSILWHHQMFYTSPVPDQAIADQNMIWSIKIWS